MVGADALLDIFLKFYSCGKKSKYSKDDFTNLFKEDLDSSIIDFAYNFFIANLNNLQLLKSKRDSEFYEEEMKNFKTNLQMNFGHSSIANEEPDFNVLLKIMKNNCKSKNKSEENILEINTNKIPEKENNNVEENEEKDDVIKIKEGKKEEEEYICNDNNNFKENRNEAEDKLLEK